jgi:hypothetical protein
MIFIRCRSSGFHHPGFAVTAFRITRFHQRISIYLTIKNGFGQTPFLKLLFFSGKKDGQVNLL